MIPHSKPLISDADIQAVAFQLKSGLLSEGETARNFENKVNNYLGVKHSIATSSGVTALDLALSALKIKQGDEVIIPSYVCNSVYKAIVNYGAIPVLCDIGTEWNMTPENVKKVITIKTKTILLVHMFGINAWDEGFKKFNLPIIEDNCQAFGLENDEKLQSLKGDIAIYSFHATKCLATGEGGMLSTNDAFYYNCALSKKNNHDPFCRLTDLQAALGISQLNHYEQMKLRRKKIANTYFDNLPPDLLFKVKKVRKNSIFFRFPLSINASVDDAINYFGSRGIAVRRGVDELLHQSYNTKDLDFKNSNDTFRTTLSIPIYPALNDEEVTTIIKEVKLYYNGRN